jgi:PEP-CTERM motif-containing protein
MQVRGIARATLIGAAAVTLGSLPAAAQVVTFSTTGSFSGGGCTTTSCAFDGFTMSFSPVGSDSFLSGSLVDLGSFVTQCVSCTPGVMQAFPSGVIFTLTVIQTAPSGGTGSFVGSVSGSVAFNPSFSSLIWMPSPNTLGIGLTTYRIVVDNTGNFNIEAPVGTVNPNATVVKAFVTATPEPSTVALMATGMVGLIPVVRRRRKT